MYFKKILNGKLEGVIQVSVQTRKPLLTVYNGYRLLSGIRVEILTNGFHPIVAAQIPVI